MGNLFNYDSFSVFALMKKKFYIANFILLFSLVIFFYRPLFSNRILVPADALQEYPFFRVDGLSDKPQNKFMYDVLVGFIPWLHFDIHELKHGSLPLWNPFQACGAPHIANMQSAFFFPLNLFVYVFGLKWGLLFLYMLKLYLAGIFLYFYLLEIKVDYSIAIIASIAFMYSGFNTGFLYWPHTNLSFFIPLGLLATELILKTPDKFNGYLILSVGVSVAIFGGHPEMAFYDSSIIAIYFIYRLLNEYRGRIAGKIFLRFTVFALIGIFVSAIQLVPFIEYLHFSYSYLIRSNTQNNYYLPFFILSLSIIPDFFNIFLQNNITNIFGGALPVDMSYVGITMFFFFLIGISKLYKNKYVFPSIIIISLIIIVAFNIPFLHQLIIKLPFFSVSSNSFMLGCAPVFIIIISAITMNEILLFNEKVNIKHAIFILLFIVLIALIVLFLSINRNSDPILLQQFYFFTAINVIITIVFLFFTIILIKYKNKSYFYPLLTIIVFLQTALPMIYFEPAIRPVYMYPENRIIKFIKEQPKPFRVFPMTYSKDQNPAWPDDISTYYGIEDLRNYDILGIVWYEKLFRTMLETEFLNLANVKYIVANSKDTVNGMETIISDNGFTLYKNPHALNRAFMVYSYIIADSESEYIEVMKKYATALGNIAIVLKNDLSYLHINSSHNTDKISNNVKFIIYKPGYIKIKVYTEKPGLLVITDTYFPGWHAYVDGIKTRIIRTDYAFDGIYIEQGNHTVVLKYMPLSFIIGIYITMFGIICLPVVYLVIYRHIR